MNFGCQAEVFQFSHHPQYSFVGSNFINFIDNWTMKIRYLFLCVSLFANCQIDAQIFKLVELFSKSANKKSLAEEVERLSAHSIKPKTEQEAYNFIKSNSLIISDKNAIRLSEVNVFECIFSLKLTTQSYHLDHPFSGC